MSLVGSCDDCRTVASLRFKPDVAMQRQSRPSVCQHCHDRREEHCRDVDDILPNLGHDLASDGGTPREIVDGADPDWHAVCRDDDCTFEAVGCFDDIAADVHDHQEDTGHEVSGEKVDDGEVDE